MTEYHEYEPQPSELSDEPAAPEISIEEPAPSTLDPMYSPGRDVDWDAALDSPQEDCNCGGMYGMHDDDCPLAGV